MAELVPPIAGDAAAVPRPRSLRSWCALLAVYGRLVGAKTRADYQYRTSFFLFLLSQALVACLDMVVLFVIFGQVQTLEGWTRPQVLLLYALSGVGFGLGDLFVSQVELVARHIRAGTFDQFLLRPIGALWQISALEFAPRRIGRLIQPAIVLVLVLPALDVEWTPLKVLLVPVTVVCGAVVFGAIWVSTSSLAFVVVNTQEIANSFTYGGSFITQYPIDVLAPWLRRFFTFVIPLAFVCYFAAAYIVGQPLPDGVPGWFSFAAPLVAAASALIARALWRAGIRHYRSTGS